GPATRVYLAVGATDLRKGFEGLFGLVKDRLGLEPLSGHVVCFCNRSRSRIKLLFWDGSGLESPFPRAKYTGTAKAACMVSTTKIAAFGSNPWELARRTSRTDECTLEIVPQIVAQRD